MKVIMNKENTYTTVVMTNQFNNNNSLCLLLSYLYIFNLAVRGRKARVL